MKHIPPKQALVGVVVLMLVIGSMAALLLLPTHQQSSAYSDSDPGYNTSYWKQAIQKDGAASAYRSFKEKNAAAPIGRQHFSAHAMGELLYAEAGLDGIAICDASFGFGCYHGFFGRAISEGGSAQIPKLDEACVKAFGPLGTGCQHGIGHGIMEYVGDDVNKGLALCKETTQLVPLLGCTSGVFMEYHTPLGGSADGVAPAPRPFDPEKPYAPCPLVPDGNKASCYFELGQWLDTLADMDYPALDSLCGALSGSDRTHCYLGVGAMTGYKEPSPATAIAACAAFAVPDEVSCRAGVSWAYYSVPEKREQADEACAFNDDARRQECAALADFTEGNEKKP